MHAIKNITSKHVAFNGIFRKRLPPFSPPLSDARAAASILLTDRTVRATLYRLPAAAKLFKHSRKRIHWTTWNCTFKVYRSYPYFRNDYPYFCYLSFRNIRLCLLIYGIPVRVGTSIGLCMLLKISPANTSRSTVFSRNDYRRFLRCCRSIRNRVISGCSGNTAECPNCTRPE